MKYLLLRCEDYARPGGQLVSLLEGAKTEHLHQLAQAGAAGQLKPQAPDQGINRFALHRGLLGLRPDDPEAAASRCYATSAGLSLADGQTAWCCDLVTQQDGQIVDPLAGQIPTKESAELLDTLNRTLGPDIGRWTLGWNSHHVLVTQPNVLQVDELQRLPAPEQLTSQPWRRALPKSAAGRALQSLLEQAGEQLDNHPINRVRTDLGENPANFLWLWGGAASIPQRSFTERTGLSGALISSNFPLRGFAESLSLHWYTGPSTLQDAPLVKLTQQLGRLAQQHDLVYAHLRVDSRDPVERLCMMERLDQLVFKPLTELLPTLGSWRLLIVIDDQPTQSVPFVGIGTGLPQHPVVKLTAENLAGSPLVFQDGRGLFDWLTDSSSHQASS